MAKNSSKESMMTLRLPPDVKKWLKVESRKSFTSQNAAIVDSLPARMAAERAERAALTGSEQ